jgi:predicted Fe-Mo cluster-binding NifX family protein
MPRFGELIAPCFGSAATITLFTVKEGKVVDEVDFCLESSEALDRFRLMRDQGVETLICGGLEQCLADLLEASDVRVISWVSGRVADLLGRFIRGELVAGFAHPGPSTKNPESKSREGC